MMTSLIYRHAIRQRASNLKILNRLFQQANLNDPSMSACSQCRQISFFGKSQGSEFSKAFSDAEKIVGYPTSFLSLRCLLSDELSNVAMHMRKLVGTKHPLLKTAKGFIFDGKNSLQMRGLIVLLMSKAAGAGQLDMSEIDTSTGIHPNQRNLAEITEMIHTANLVHKGVLNLSSLSPTENSAKDMEFGNKMAVLSGDFLLANASTGLAELRNTKVVEIMSSAIADLIHGEFLVNKDRDGNSILSSSTTLDDWFRETHLSSGSLIANSCQAALHLVHHSEEKQKLAYSFGKNIAVAFRISEELQPFMNGEANEDNSANMTTSLLSILHLGTYGNSYLDSIQSKTDTVDISKVFKVLKYSPLLKDAKDMCRQHGQMAIDSIQHFEKTEARDALENIAHAAITQTGTRLKSWPI